MVRCFKFYFRLSADFVCWRGVLTKLAATPYDSGSRAEGWKIAVAKFRGTHYIREYDTEKHKENERNMTQRQRLMSYWGHKFEKDVTKRKRQSFDL